MKYLFQFKAALYVLVISLLATMLVGKNITDEEMVSLNGDMPRYLMNGVYLLDVLRDFPLLNFLEYSTYYFSRYPALSIGHHPPLMSVAEIPFFAVFGVSVFSGKLTILFFIFVGCIFWFKFVQCRYDSHIAFLSTILFITTPFIVGYSRIVMSEIPALALMIVAAYYFQQYLKNSDRRKYLILFVFSFSLSVYAKQLAIILGLALAWEFVSTKGFRKVFAHDILWAGIAFAALMVPIGAITLLLSPSNVSFGTSASIEEIIDKSWLLNYIEIIWTHHLTPPVLFLSLMGIALGLWKRDRRCYLLIGWIISYYLVMTFVTIGVPRFTMFWIPPFCLFAASLVDFFPFRYWRIGVAMIIFVIAGGQAVLAYNLESTFARGYKEAAQYVVDNRKGTAVLYNAKIDSGYFIFQTRALDSEREMIVLLADKVLATRYLDWIFEERVHEKKGIYKVLKDFGVCHVVMEDKFSNSRSIEWLREEVQKDQYSRSIEWLREEVQKDQFFILKKTIPIQTNSKKLMGVTLKIYEYKFCVPPNLDATLEMNLPLINRSIKVRFDRLVKGL